MPTTRSHRYDITRPLPLRSSVDLDAAELQVALGDYDQDCGPPLWSSTQPLPVVGEFVHAGIGEFGLCQVAGYFIEHGWLGLRVEPLDPPAWWVKSAAERADDDLPELRGMTCVFGVDLLPLIPRHYRQISSYLDEAAQEVGCFSSFWDMLNTEPGYRPTIHPDTLQHRVVRRVYDREQGRRGDPRKVFPYDPVDGTGR